MIACGTRLSRLCNVFEGTLAYILPIDEALDQSLRRVGAKQLRQALRRLLPETAESPNVHQARKAFKRFRALLLFAKPGFDPGVFERLDGGVRDIARCFAHARDRQAMRETVATIEARCADPQIRRVTAALKTILLAEPESGGLAAHGSQSKALDKLREIDRKFRAMPIRIAEFQDLAKGLTSVYEKGRDGMKARRDGLDDTDEAFHDWRKSVQRHWRHLQLLSAAWPGVIQQQAKLARELSQLLGDDHDIAILRDFALNRRMALGTKQDLAAFSRFCGTLQVSLRVSASARGERLFAEKPGAMAKRFAIYWRTEPLIASNAIGKTEADPIAPHILTVVK